MVMWRFLCTPRGTPLWCASIEQVRRRYAAIFGADTSADPDWFVVAYEPAGRDAFNGDDERSRREVLSSADVLDSQAGQVLACVGVTGAAGRPLFCERYLPAPAEDVLAVHLGHPCDRSEVVEVGPFAAEVPGAGRELLRVLPMFAWERGMRYGLVTVTQQLRHLLDQEGYPFEPLVDARQDRLTAEEQAAWGSYYEQRPRTGVIRLERLAPVLVRSAGRYRSTNLSFSRVDDGKERDLAVA